MRKEQIEEMAKHCPCYFGEKCCIDGELPEKCDMLKNQYLVIKLHGNWIEREQTKQRVKMFVEDIDVLNDENIITCHCTKAMVKERFPCKEAFKDYVKRKIAVGIGEYLLEKGLIRFKESEEEYTIKFDGVITVISEEEKGGK